MTKIVRAVAATLLFAVVLLVLHVLHMRYLQVDVVFYSAVADALVASLIVCVGLVLLPYFRLFDRFEKGLLLVIWVLMGYSFAISVPTVIDRSLSFYILEKLQQRGGSIALSDFEDVFTRGYAREHRLVDVRVTEQLESGTVVMGADGCVRLTARGDRLADFSRFYRRNLLPRQRLLMGEYTDVLTDPFRASPDAALGPCRGATPGR